MRVEDVDHFWQRLADEPDPDRVARKSELYYLAVLAAIANGQAIPNPAELARAVLRGVAGDYQAAEVRYVQSSDQAVSGDNIS